VIGHCEWLGWNHAGEAFEACCLVLFLPSISFTELLVSFATPLLFPALLFPALLFLALLFPALVDFEA
jgi:hypothetical protein